MFLTFATMNWSAALMKDGGKPMGPTPAEKKKAEERAKQRQEEAALFKRSITDYAERLDLRDELAIIEKKPCWTDPMDQISQVFWTNNLKELRDLDNRMKAKMDEYLKKFKKEHNGMSPIEVERQELREAIGVFIENTTRDERVYWLKENGHYLDNF